MPKSANKILTVHLYLFLGTVAGTVAKIYSFFLLCGYGFSYIFSPGKAKKAIQSLSQIQNAPITALVLILTFWAHPEWSPTAKIIYMAVTYSILVLGYTCVNLPYGTPAHQLVWRRQHQIWLPCRGSALRHHLRRLPSVLLPQDQGGSRSTCGTEASAQHPVESGSKEQALPARPPRPAALRLHPLRTERELVRIR